MTDIKLTFQSGFKNLAKFFCFVVIIVRRARFHNRILSSNRTTFGPKYLSIASESSFWKVWFLSRFERLKSPYLLDWWRYLSLSEWFPNPKIRPESVVLASSAFASCQLVVCSVEITEGVFSSGIVLLSSSEDNFSTLLLI